MKIRRTGDRVHLTFQGVTVEAMVLLASSNGRSLMLRFEALLGGYAGTMPVLYNPETKDYRDLMTSQPVGLE
jgi:hypothetical protein